MNETQELAVRGWVAYLEAVDAEMGPSSIKWLMTHHLTDLDPDLPDWLIDAVAARLLANDPTRASRP